MVNDYAKALADFRNIENMSASNISIKKNPDILAYLKVYDTLGKNWQTIIGLLEKLSSPDWVLVPRSPTVEMTNAAWYILLNAKEYKSGLEEEIYAAMINAKGD